MEADVQKIAILSAKKQIKIETEEKEQSKSKLREKAKQIALEKFRQKKNAHVVTSDEIGKETDEKTNVEIQEENINTRRESADDFDFAD